MAVLELWTEYKAAPSVELKKQLMLNYTNLVHYVIHNSKFINFDIFDERDYFQFGIEGLSEAVDRFDPEFGTKFETYAIQRIRGKIIDELRKVQIKPRKYNDSEDSINYTNVSLTDSVSEDEGFMLYEVIPDESEEEPTETAENNETLDYLIKALQQLDERDRLIITLYYYEHLNYKEIAKLLDITVSRVSQVHSRIIKKLKNKLSFINV